MTFVKGRARTGGKPKGWKQPYKVSEILAKANFSPVEELLKIFPTLQDKDKVRVLLELQSYLESKPRPALDADDLSKLSTQELLILVRSKMPELEKATPILLEGKDVQSVETAIPSAPEELKSHPESGDS